MKIALCIMAHESAAEAVKTCCPFWKAAGLDLIGLENCDSQLKCWPECFTEVIETLVDPFCDRKESHPRRMSAFLSELAMLSAYDGFILTEADSIVLGKPHGLDWEKFGAFVAGYCPPEWACGNEAFLLPWPSTKSAIDSSRFGFRLRF